MNVGQHLENGHFLLMEKYKIISIANVISLLEPVLYKLIKLVHIDIHQELGCEITEGQAFASTSTLKTLYHSLNEPESIGISNMSFYNFNKTRLINRGKKFSNVAFKHPHSFCMPKRCRSSRFLKCLNSSMCPLEITARIGIVNKFFIKKWVQRPVESAVN